MILYHGSNTDFDKFDPKTIKYVGCNGDGFYFTDCPKYAGTYGNIVKAWDVDIKNPLKPDTKNISKDIYFYLLLYIWKNTEYKEDLKNYGWFPDNLHKEVFKKLAFDLSQKESLYSGLFDIVHCVTGSMRELLKILKKVSGIEFDCIISEGMKEWVIFEPCNIKKIDYATK